MEGLWHTRPWDIEEGDIEGEENDIYWEKLK